MRLGWQVRAGCGRARCLVADRPPCGRAAAGLVFLIAMVEPGAAMVLGLRRTLAFQIVEEATGPSPFPRTAVWSLMAGVLGLCGWLFFRWSGRASSLPELSARDRLLTVNEAMRRAAPVVSLVAAVSLCSGASWFACRLRDW